MNGEDQQIVPGLSVRTSGQATVDPPIADALFDLAISSKKRRNSPSMCSTLWRLLCSRLARETLSQQNRSRPTTLYWPQCWPLS